jgi:hypothetical protein
VQNLRLFGNHNLTRPLEGKRIDQIVQAISSSSTDGAAAAATRPHRSIRLETGRAALVWVVARNDGGIDGCCCCCCCSGGAEWEERVALAVPVLLVVPQHGAPDGGGTPTTHRRSFRLSVTASCSALSPY